MAWWLPLWLLRSCCQPDSCPFVGDLLVFPVAWRTFLCSDRSVLLFCCPPTWSLISLYVWNIFDSQLIFDRCCSLKTLAAYLSIVFSLEDFILVLLALGARSHHWHGPIWVWFWSLSLNLGMLVPALLPACGPEFVPTCAVLMLACWPLHWLQCTRFLSGSHLWLALTAQILAHIWGHFLVSLLSVNLAIHLQLCLR